MSCRVCFKLETVTNHVDVDALKCATNWLIYWTYCRCDTFMLYEPHIWKNSLIHNIWLATDNTQFNIPHSCWQMPHKNQLHYKVYCWIRATFWIALLLVLLSFLSWYLIHVLCWSHWSLEASPTTTPVNPQAQVSIPRVCTGNVSRNLIIKFLDQERKWTVSRFILESCEAAWSIFSRSTVCSWWQSCQRVTLSLSAQPWILQDSSAATNWSAGTQVWVYYQIAILCALKYVKLCAYLNFSRILHHSLMMASANISINLTKPSTSLLSTGPRCSMRLRRTWKWTTPNCTQKCCSRWCESLHLQSALCRHTYSGAE